MPLSAHGKPLSPYEKKVLATLEDELRAEDPALAAALSRTPPSSSAEPEFLPPSRHVLHPRAQATSGAQAARAVRQPDTWAWSAVPTATRYGVSLLAVVLFLAAVAAAPPAWSAVLGVVLWLVVLPFGLLRLRAGAERRDASA